MELRNTDAVINAKVADKVRILNAIVKVNTKGEFLKTVLNSNALPKTIHLDKSEFEPLQNLSVHNLFKNTVTDISVTDGRVEILNQFRLEHVNKEESDTPHRQGGG